MKTSRGFTLIEILIVLVIIAVMSSVAVLSIGAPSYSKFLSEVQKTAVTLELISDEAVYTDSIIECKVYSTAINCQRYKDELWSNLDLGRLVSWSWPDKISIVEVYVDNAPLKLGDSVRFLPTGSLSTLDFRVTDGKHTSWISGDINGDFRVSN